MTCTRMFALAWTLAAAVDGIADAKPVTRYGAMVTKAVRGETGAAVRRRQAVSLRSRFQRQPAGVHDGRDARRPGVR